MKTSCSMQWWAIQSFS